MIKRLNNSYFVLLCGLVLFFSGCMKTTVGDFPDFKKNLAEYINSNKSFPLVSDSLIACATGGVGALATEPNFPISVLFLPEGNASQFLYYESDNANINPELHDNYWHQDLENSSIFNGYLRKFNRASQNSDVWGIVTFVRDYKIYISNPIKIKYDSKPSENNPSLISIDQSEKKEPKFSWEDGSYDENAIYFQVVSDSDDNLISGTYTYEKTFQYYRTENVVLNIKPQNPVIVLTAGETYNFTLMGVSEDNWVNVAGQKSFKVE